MNIPSSQLYDKGIYDSWIDYDNQVFIDPVCFKDPRLFKDPLAAWQKFTAWFNAALELARMSAKSDYFWMGAIEVLINGKHRTCSLGYAMPGKARSLTNPATARIIFDFLIEHRKVYPFTDVLPLLGQRIGWDLFSDLMVSVMADEFLDYTADRKNGPFDGHGQPVVFVPRALLRSVPISEF